MGRLPCCSFSLYIMKGVLHSLLAIDPTKGVMMAMDVMHVHENSEGIQCVIYDWNYKGNDGFLEPACGAG